MAILKAKDARKLEPKELDKRLRDLKVELAKERANISIGASVTSPGRIREMRRTIARLETIRLQPKPSLKPKEAQRA